MGGLFVGPQAKPLDEGLRRYLDETWRRVEAMSGQTFTRTTLDRLDWTYDTELSCRAVVAMRALAPGHELAFFSSLQRAFYRDGVDLTDVAAYRDLVAGHPVDAGAFLERLVSDDTAAETGEEFRTAVAVGSGGFPTVLIDQGPASGGELIPLAAGYQEAAAMTRIFHVIAGSVADEVCTDPEACANAA